jgi:hypothetical protein
MRPGVPLELALLALLAYLIGIGRGERIAKYYNITAKTLVFIAFTLLCLSLR